MGVVQCVWLGIVGGENASWQVWERTGVCQIVCLLPHFILDSEGKLMGEKEERVGKDGKGERWAGGRMGLGLELGLGLGLGLGW